MHDWFELHIDGMDSDWVSKIDGFTVKQTVKPLYFGSERLPELEPVELVWPNVTFYMSEAHARSFQTWHREAVAPWPWHAWPVNVTQCSHNK